MTVRFLLKKLNIGAILLIIKPRTIPLALQQYQALERRLPAHHPKMPLIQENLRKRLAGYKGECALDYPLSFLPEKKYSILHDVRLQASGHFFQIDTVLLSEMFIVLIDAKNMAGKLYFDPRFHQLIQTLDGEEKAFSDPLIQARRHKELFTQWLAKSKLPPVPLLSLVAISNSYAVILTAPENKELHQIVIHHEYLPYRINEFAEVFPNPVLTEKERKKIGQQLIKQHTPLEIDILQKLQISPDELPKGIYCPNCGRLPMKRDYGKWICPYCQHTDKEAHVLTMKTMRSCSAPRLQIGRCRTFYNVRQKAYAKGCFEI